MNNKSGFTLVEIVIVIALLGVLLLLVVPNIIDRFANAKKNMFYNDVLTLFTNASSTYISRSFDDPDTPTYFCKDLCGHGYDKLIDAEVSDDISYSINMYSNGLIYYIFVKSPEFSYELENHDGIEKADIDKSHINGKDDTFVAK